MLLTATVYITNPQNRQSHGTFRAFLDSGSEKTFISNKVQNVLNLPTECHEVLSVSTFGTRTPMEMNSTCVSFEIVLPDGSGEIYSVEAHAVPFLTGTLRREAISAADFEALSVYPAAAFADKIPMETDEFQPDLILGLNCFLQLVKTDKTLSLPSGLSLVPSRLGLLLGGSVVELSDDQCLSSVRSTSACNLSTASLHLLTKSTRGKKNMVPNPEPLWSLEALDIHDSPDEDSDEKARESFKQTVEFKDGRYWVSWPWITPSADLPSNREIVYKKFRNQLRKLEKDKKQLEMYDAVIQDQCKNKIVEYVPDETKVDGILHYISHHGVVTPGKTTKLRVVYNGSLKEFSDQKSFNDCIHRGPIDLPDLPSILSRFRVYKYGVIADIQKAFLQIYLHETDRDCTRFFWINDVNVHPLWRPDNLRVLRFTRVLFGAKSSPSLLNQTIDYHLSQSGTPTAEFIRANIYVDNVVCGANSNKETLQLYTEGKELFAKASMNLREWQSNDRELMTTIPEEDRVTTPAVKVLGIHWDTRSDVLRLNIKSFSAAKTKRQVVEQIATIFDPLGLCSPVYLSGRLFIQSLWREKLHWDDDLSPAQFYGFQKIQGEVSKLAEFKTPRFIGHELQNAEAQPVYELHCLTDGSTTAYTANLYLRTTVGTSSVTNLLLSKTRLNPINGLSVPKTELMGVFLGVKLMQQLSPELQIPVAKKEIWTDSLCVIHWISSHKKLPIFVENRLTQIRAAKDVTFRYIPTNDNSADIGTKPHTYVEFLGKQVLWLHGPSFLSTQRSEWPNMDKPEVTPDMLENWESQTKPKCRSVLHTTGLMANTVGPALQKKNDAKNPAIIELQKIVAIKHRVSTLKSLLWCTMFILKFINVMVWSKLSPTIQQKYRSISTFFKHSTDRTNTKALQNAKLYWEIRVQSKAFPDVLKALKHGTTHSLIKQMNLFLDDNHVQAISYPQVRLSKCGCSSSVVNILHNKQVDCHSCRDLTVVKGELFTTLTLFLFPFF